LVPQRAIGSESPDMGIRSVVASGLVAEGDHLAGLAVDLRMRGEGPALDCSTGVVETARVESDGIDFVGKAVFLQREQPSGVNECGRIRRAGVQASNIGIVGEAVAVVPEPGAALLAVRPQPLGFDVARRVAYLSAANAKVRHDSSCMEQ